MRLGSDFKIAMAMQRNACDWDPGARDSSSLIRASDVQVHSYYGGLAPADHGGAGASQPAPGAADAWSQCHIPAVSWTPEWSALRAASAVNSQLLISLSSIDQAP